MKLQEIFNIIGHFGSDIGCNDKGSNHSYLETYEKILQPFKNGCTFLEIGLAMGDSINLFDCYFENSTIYGVDISVVFEPKEYCNTVKIIKADATKLEVLTHLNDVKFDVVIDDGSHMEDDQVATFNLLKSQMNKGGIYIIEDILSLDTNRERFKSLHDNCEIIDLRKVKGRFDDVLIIYRF
jgi:23S rRNA U2552 (ribose-2'-O)-methylase RlmE/FtsJ